MTARDFLIDQKTNSFVKDKWSKQADKICNKFIRQVKRRKFFGDTYNAWISFLGVADHVEEQVCNWLKENNIKFNYHCPWEIAISMKQFYKEYQ